ncbi:plasmid pRiA4b ORF-3 family protein [Labedaea rhizosphaerae]|uniref:PRiA4b ORF-3-like protein n=1 Tax=Labedaea rhizosphaerae TaxID=598644 RepID=A0A4R6SQF2_LABRH|nr:plasmid pRiA4b ORF-3 family protein [Labedaea rhizosphaerae]TDQ05840.1 pRiA4b ORF-3-like protein [Labedaea rhizosphaerae]
MDAGDPDLTTAMTEMLADFAEVDATGDPMAVEVWTSSLLGTWWLAAPDAVGVIGDSVVEHLRTTADARARALLTAVTAVAPVELADKAAAAVRELAGLGLPAPVWADAIGVASLEGCWCWGDAYGDVMSVFCRFDGPMGPHALSVLIDWSQPLGGYATDAWLTDEPDQALADARRMLAEDADGDLMELRELDPAEARRLIENAFQVTDLVPERLDPDAPEATLPDYRALVLARCRLLPEPVAPTPLTGAEQAKLAEEFLAETDLEPTELVRRYTRRFIEYGAMTDPGDPLRASVLKVDGFFTHALADNPAIPEIEALTKVAVAFTEWAAQRRGLTEAARTRLMADTELCAREHSEEAILLWLPEVRQESYILRVDVAGAKPPIWRRLRVPGDMSLAELHIVLQIAFEWDDSQEHIFLINGLIASIPYELEEFDFDERAVGVSQVAAKPGGKLMYIYDHTEQWRHVIKFEKVEPPDNDRPVACLGGRQPSPSTGRDFDPARIDATLRALTAPE